jgi:uncharacterized protein (TIGR03663 family)
MSKQQPKKPVPKSVPREPVTISLNVRTLVIIVLLIFAFWSRFYRLGDKPLHHDESLFGYYSYHLSQAGRYDYNPMLHGPFMLDVNALVYILFGDSDFTLRFATACLGMGILFLLFLYRQRLGPVGFPVALGLCVISPTLMYYSRFFRHDIPLAFFYLLALWFYIKFFTEGKGKALLWGIVCSMMLICIKENSLIFLFTIGTFAVLLFVIDFVKGLRAKHIGWTAIEKGYAFILGRDFIGIFLVTIILWALFFIFYGSVLEGVFQKLFATKDFFRLRAPLWHYPLFLIAFAISFFFLAFLRTWTEEIYGEDALLSRVYKAVVKNWVYLLIGIMISLLAYVLIFTTFLTDRTIKGFFDIYRKTFVYWWGQHKEQRIYGAYHYYLPILGIYEFPVVLLVLGGAIGALLRRKWGRRLLIPGWVGLSILALILYHALHITFNADKWDKGPLHVSSPLHIYIIISLLVFGGVLTCMYLWRNERFTALLVYWTTASVLIYSWAGEKVPWVSVHIVLPLLLLAGVYAQKFIQTRAYQRAPYVWHVLTVVFVLWNLKSAIILCFVNSANTAERLIYGHTTWEVKRVVEEIDRLSFLLGTEKNTRIVVRGQIMWPMWWYMREYKQWTEHENLSQTTAPILVLDWDEAAGIPNIQSNYHCTRYKVRTWWQPRFLDVGRMAAIWKTIIPKHHIQGSPVVDEIRDSKEEWKKLINYLLYRTYFEHYAAPYPSMSSVDFAFCVRKGILEHY